MLNAVSVLAVNIPVGEHVTRKIGGLTFNLDTIWTTVAGLRPSSSVWASTCGPGPPLACPGKLQLTWELVIGNVSDQVENGLGPGLPERGAAGGHALHVHPDRRLARDPSRPVPQHRLLPVAVRRRQPDLRPGRPGVHPDHPGRLPGQGVRRLRQVLLPQAGRHVPAAHHRGDGQAGHAGPPAVRQPVLRAAS